MGYLGWSLDMTPLVLALVAVAAALAAGLLLRGPRW
jgi:hypothetical protein